MPGAGRAVYDDDARDPSRRVVGTFLFFTVVCLRRSIVSWLLSLPLHTSFHSTFAVMHAPSTCRGQRGKSGKDKFNSADVRQGPLCSAGSTEAGLVPACALTSRIPVSAGVETSWRQLLPLFHPHSSSLPGTLLGLDVLYILPLEFLVDYTRRQLGHSSRLYSCRVRAAGLVEADPPGMGATL